MTSAAKAIGLTFVSNAAFIVGASVPYVADLWNKRFGVPVAPSGGLDDGNAAKSAPELSPRFNAGAYSVAAGAILFGTLVEVLPNGTKSWAAVVGDKYNGLAALASLLVGVLAFILLEIAMMKIAPDMDCPCARMQHNCACSGSNHCGCGCAENKAVKKLSWSSLIAMTLHHIPEGIAFFIAATGSLDHHNENAHQHNHTNGAIVGIILLIHVFPEGLSIGVPTFAAYPKQPWRSILHGAIAGFAQPLGALIAFAFFHSHPPSALVLSISMCMIAGMLLTLAVRGLLPLARTLDPKDTICSTGIFAGMCIVFFSLAMFSVVQ